MYYLLISSWHHIYIYSIFYLVVKHLHKLPRNLNITFRFVQRNNFPYQI